MRGKRVASAIRVLAGSIQDNHGFSLLEVLVASSILTVALVSLAQVLAVAVTANAAAGKTTSATLFAAQKMEDLRAATWESLEGSTGAFVDYPIPEFTRRWSVDRKSVV